MRVGLIPRESRIGRDRSMRGSDEVANLKSARKIRLWLTIWVIPLPIRSIERNDASGLFRTGDKTAGNFEFWDGDVTLEGQ